ncbi:MAG: hypothetical protein WDN45_14190 [Caulobacteraceae bacterium]
MAQSTAPDTPATHDGFAAPVAPPSANDIEWVRTGLAAVKAGNLEQVRIALTEINHPVGAKLLEWAARRRHGATT